MYLVEVFVVAGKKWVVLCCHLLVEILDCTLKKLFLMNNNINVYGEWYFWWSQSLSCSSFTTI